MLKLKKFKDELFTTMLPPNYQKVCSSTDDYFDLIKYCWECIGDVSREFVNINYFSADAQYEISHYKKSLQHLHIRIDECYTQLKLIGNHADVSHVSHVYTAPTNSKGRKQ